MTDDTATWLRAWDSQGPHRTGTDGDNAGADWLANVAAALGADPVIHEFPLDRLDPQEAALELDGERIEGVPLFDAPDRADIMAALGPVGSGAPLAVAQLDPRAVYTQAYRDLRQDPTQRGLIIVCQGAHPGLGLLNAEQFTRPYGAPALQVPSEAGPRILAAAARGAHARLVLRSERQRELARNVEVTLPGHDRSRRPVVVMTPRSSWWQSTAERGGGIVCWLETLRALLADRPGCDVVLTANSGHELGHLGLDAFLARRPGWDGPQGATWIHYGANIGAAGGRLSIMSASDDLRAAMRDALTAAGQGPDEIAPPTTVPSGETRDIHRSGGRYLTLVGTNPWFHLPHDRWPATVDVAAITRVARGAARMVAGLTR
ncbi:MAG: hypothetical protein AB7O80_00235 [Acetobacteraceae bacterium]